jgi:hypothetical protein
MQGWRSGQRSICAPTTGASRKRRIAAEEKPLIDPRPETRARARLASRRGPTDGTPANGSGTGRRTPRRPARSAHLTIKQLSAQHEPFAVHPSLEAGGSVEPIRSLGSGRQTTMRRCAHHFSLGSLLILYGVVTLCGPALHALPGFAHSVAELSSGGDSASGQRGGNDRSTHDCPICQFHAQAQYIVSADDECCIDVVRILAPDELPVFWPPAPDQPSGPRAPPSPRPIA